MKRSLSTCIIFAVLLLYATHAMADDTKVGFVDLDFILQKLEDGREAKKKFQRALKRRQRTFLKKRDELSKLKSQLEKKIEAKAKESDLKEMLQDYQKKLAEMQKYYASSQKVLQRMQEKTFAPLLNRISALVGLVASQNSVTLMLERTRSALLYADDKLDYSTQVIKAYEAGKK
ncbi:MAG: OmpH family outer membrane protein [Myxococcales bacterium]|nr:OmpH family outer membrane protein [Myxococcales bacterium]